MTDSPTTHESGATAVVREQIPERSRDTLQPILHTATVSEWADVLAWLNESAPELPLVFERLRCVLEYTLGRELLRDVTEPAKRTFTVELPTNLITWTGKCEGCAQRFLRRLGLRG